MKLRLMLLGLASFAILHLRVHAADVSRQVAIEVAFRIDGKFEPVILRGPQDMAGTTGLKKWIDGTRIDTHERLLSEADKLQFKIKTVATGFSDWLNAGTNAGAGMAGKGYDVGGHLTGIAIRIDGPNAKRYHVRYAAHFANDDWSKWVDGPTELQSNNQSLEAIRISVVELPPPPVIPPPVPPDSPGSENGKSNVPGEEPVFRGNLIMLTIATVILGALFLVAWRKTFGADRRETPTDADRIFRVLLALAASAVTGYAVGVIDVKGQLGGFKAQATGGFAVFVIVYCINAPRDKVRPAKDPSRSQPSTAPRTEPRSRPAEGMVTLARPPVTKISHSEIREKLKGLIPFHRDQIEKSYIGIRVRWKVILHSVSDDKNGTAVVHGELTDTKTAIRCDGKMTNFHCLAHAIDGEEVEIEGTIDAVSSAYTELKDCFATRLQ